MPKMDGHGPEKQGSQTGRKKQELARKIKTKIFRCLAWAWAND
jgi:hypothetical protein